MGKNGLGRGLESLFSVYNDNNINEAEVNDRVEPVREKVNTEGVSQIEISKIDPNKNQPRKVFDQIALNELASSIKQHGIIQPIILNKSGDRYMIVAGERRWRAAQIAGLKVVPAVVKEYTDSQIKEISIIENLQTGYMIHDRVLREAMVIVTK